MHHQGERQETEQIPVSKPETHVSSHVNSLPVAPVFIVGLLLFWVNLPRRPFAMMGAGESFICYLGPVGRQARWASRKAKMEHAGNFHCCSGDWEEPPANSGHFRQSKRKRSGGSEGAKCNREINAGVGRELSLQIHDAQDTVKDGSISESERERAPPIAPIAPPIDTVYLILAER